LLERHVYSEHPLRADYRPTAPCRDLWPVLVSIWAWERDWAPHPEGPLPVMRHTPCRTDMAPALTCAACAAPVTADDLDGRWGPAGSWPRSIPAGTTRRRRTAAGDGPGLFPETMTLFGNRWSAAVLGAAFLGVSRFTDFQVRLGAPAATVADRLRALRDLGVLEATSTATSTATATAMGSTATSAATATGSTAMGSTGGPARAEAGRYALTAKGRAFFPVVATALGWAETWLAAPEGATLALTHRACGAPFVPALACDHCDGVLGGGDIAIV
jgi:DNA-binding HxlR family transcriptional regulator